MRAMTHPMENDRPPKVVEQRHAVSKINLLVLVPGILFVFPQFMVLVPGILFVSLYAKSHNPDKFKSKTSEFKISVSA